MFRRRAKGSDTASDAGPAADPTPESPDAVDHPDADAAAKPSRPNGPWDVSELDGSHSSHGVARLDLGALRVRPVAGMKVQMQVDQATGRATSVLLVGEQAAVQLMAIAAAKTKPLWPTTKRALQSDADRRGGTAQDGAGPWGPVLRMTIPASTPDGKQGLQPSVVLGIDGPRWMLRATMIGKAAIDQAQMNQMMGIVQDTVVVRGDGPMAPGEILALSPPTRPSADDPQDETA
jgi:hypothetical protein